MTISVTILQYTTDEQLSRVMFWIQSHLTITYEFNFLKYFNRTFWNFRVKLLAARRHKHKGVEDKKDKEQFLAQMN